jgi:hypothetical protein
VHVDQRIHQAHALSPQTEEFSFCGTGGGCLGRRKPAVEVRDAILQRRGDAGRVGVGHALVGPEGLERLLERRRLGHRRRQLVGRTGHVGREDVAPDDEQGQRRGQRERADAEAPQPGLAPLATHPPGHFREPVTRRAQGRQRAHPRHPLVQPLELGGALGALCHVQPRLGGARLTARIPQRQQLIHPEVRHATASSPSQRRSFTCARAS